MWTEHISIFLTLMWTLWRSTLNTYFQTVKSKQAYGCLAWWLNSTNINREQITPLVGQNPCPRGPSGNHEAHTQICEYLYDECGERKTVNLREQGRESTPGWGNPGRLQGRSGIWDEPWREGRLLIEANKKKRHYMKKIQLEQKPRDEKTQSIQRWVRIWVKPLNLY